MITHPGEIGDVGFAHLPNAAAAAWNHAEWFIEMFQMILSIPLGIDHYTIRQAR